ncbi:MAG: hypothetical protein ACLSB9_15950 [Hydrogeniiclostridium mannosilyticum]
MLSFTSYTKIFTIANNSGALLASGAFIGGLIYLIFWGIMRFDVHIGPIILLLCFLAGVQLFFIGMIGEYILGLTSG